MYEIQLDLTHSTNCAGDSDRMPRFTLFLLLIVLFLAKFSVASALSPCVGPDIHEWHNCEGTHFLANGDRYIGAWENGKKHGQGMYYFTDGATWMILWMGGEPCSGRMVGYGLVLGRIVIGSEDNSTNRGKLPDTYTRRLHPPGLNEPHRLLYFTTRLWAAFLAPCVHGSSLYETKNKKDLY